MRTFLALSFVCVAFAAVGSALGQTTKEPFSISISTAKPEVKVGDRIYITVTMTNTSDHDIACDYYFYDNMDRNYRYDVVYEDGQPADKIVRKTASNSDPCIIGLGQTAKSDSMISRGFDFTRPGKYTIQVSRDVWGDDSKPNTWQTHHNDPEIEIKSNTITITVLGAEEPPPAQK